MAEALLLGTKVRALRRQAGLTQAGLAEKLEISASYLNLLEHNRRPMTAGLLIKLAQTFKVDLARFAADDDRRLEDELMEVFGDPLFEDAGLTNKDIRELTTAAPGVARAVRRLYGAFLEFRSSVDSLATRLSAGGSEQIHAGSPSEEVSDLVQARANHFDGLERAAENLWSVAELEPNDLEQRLARFLQRELYVALRVVRPAEMRGAVRRYDRQLRVLTLSEALPVRARSFQIAHQVALLTQGEEFDRLSGDPLLTTPESRALARIALANYFAAAVIMPYQPFLEAARKERYDIEVLGDRFRTSFETVCHRLTSLRRPGQEGVPFHFLRIDIAGNLSKRFSGTSFRFPRFGTGCPRWDVYRAFLSPGRILVQLSKMPDGRTFFSISRADRRRRGGFHAPETLRAIGLGCEVERARELIYADGIDLEQLDAAVPIGITCRLCERRDCDQRAFPALQAPLALDEDVRGSSLYAQTG
jgi:predicted transcriptional regulator/transcriptional regulator with XRE-family HTH domain